MFNNRMQSLPAVDYDELIVNHSESWLTTLPTHHHWTCWRTLVPTQPTATSLTKQLYQGTSAQGLQLQHSKAHLAQEIHQVRHIPLETHRLDPLNHCWWFVCDRWAIVDLYCKWQLSILRAFWTPAGCDGYIAVTTRVPANPSPPNCQSRNHGKDQPRQVYKRSVMLF